MNVDALIAAALARICASIDRRIAFANRSRAQRERRRREQQSKPSRAADRGSKQESMKCVN